MSQWQQFQDKHQQLNLREKYLILISGLLLICFLSFNFLLEPLLIKYQQGLKDNSRSEKLLKNLQTQQIDIELKLSSDPLAQFKQQLERLSLQHKRVLAELDEQQLALVDSDEMSQTLRELLNESSDLQLKMLSSEKPKVILSVAGTGGGNNEALISAREALLYRHVISVKIRGKYFSVLKFLKQIEQRSSQILWGDINYEVQEYPYAIITFDVYTISTDEEFIGVKD
ncbi:MAG: hypothetical protein HRU25_09205 [Psychrobium sp.]|nr:hypothetical protein [Psychrobium sp.]